MSRTGVEAKPAWQAVPVTVRRLTERHLGAPVKRAARIWGGYTPTPTYRLRLTDGRCAFFKAVSAASNEFARAAHAREERVYRDHIDLIQPWAPTLFGAFQADDWMVLLLEDLGPKSAPPWTPRLAREVAGALGKFHQARLGHEFPSWLPGPERSLLTESRLWEWIDDADRRNALAALAGPAAPDALDWLTRAAPELGRASRSLIDAAEPHTLLHRDVRSDNLRWLDRRLRLFDWPHLGIGPAEYDVAAFAQSVTAEGGVEPEAIMGWYAERAPVRSNVLDAAVAGLAGFFADQTWRPDIPGLPRLRAFQRRQLGVTLKWASLRLELPPPDWLQYVRHDYVAIPRSSRRNPSG
jgi:hypothetical protein